MSLLNRRKKPDVFGSKSQKVAGLFLCRSDHFKGFQKTARVAHFLHQCERSKHYAPSANCIDGWVAEDGG